MRKRSLTPQFKFQIVLETLKREKSQAELARQYGIHHQLIVAWKRLFLHLGPSIFESKKERKDEVKK
jgi:transposase-like protein